MPSPPPDDNSDPLRSGLLLRLSAAKAARRAQATARPSTPQELIRPKPEQRATPNSSVLGSLPSLPPSALKHLVDSTPVPLVLRAATAALEAARRASVTPSSTHVVPSHMAAAADSVYRSTSATHSKDPSAASSGHRISDPSVRRLFSDETASDGLPDHSILAKHPRRVLTTVGHLDIEGASAVEEGANHTSFGSCGNGVATSPNASMPRAEDAPSSASNDPVLSSDNALDVAQDSQFFVEFHSARTTPGPVQEAEATTSQRDGASASQAADEQNPPVEHEVEVELEVATEHEAVVEHEAASEHGPEFENEPESQQGGEAHQLEAAEQEVGKDLPDAARELNAGEAENIRDTSHMVKQCNSIAANDAGVTDSTHDDAFPALEFDHLETVVVKREPTSPPARSTQRKKRKRSSLSEVFRLQKALETARWTDSVAVRAQSEVIVISDDEGIPNCSNHERRARIQATERIVRPRKRAKSEPGIRTGRATEANTPVGKEGARPATHITSERGAASKSRDARVHRGTGKRFENKIADALKPNGGVTGTNTDQNKVRGRTSARSPKIALARGVAKRPRTVKANSTPERAVGTRRSTTPAKKKSNIRREDAAGKQSGRTTKRNRATGHTAGSQLNDVANGTTRDAAADGGGASSVQRKKRNSARSNKLVAPETAERASQTQSRRTEGITAVKSTDSSYLSNAKRNTRMKQPSRIEYSNTKKKGKSPGNVNKTPKTGSRKKDKVIEGDRLEKSSFQRDVAQPTKRRRKGEPHRHSPGSKTRNILAETKAELGKASTNGPQFDDEVLPESADKAPARSSNDTENGSEYGHDVPLPGRRQSNGLVRGSPLRSGPPRRAAILKGPKEKRDGNRNSTGHTGSEDDDGFNDQSDAEEIVPDLSERDWHMMVNGWVVECKAMRKGWDRLSEAEIATLLQGPLGFSQELGMVVPEMERFLYGKAEASSIDKRARDRQVTSDAEKTESIGLSDEDIRRHGRNSRGKKRS